MSSGHKHQGGFGINSQVLDRYLKNENIQRELYQPRKIDRSFDIAYLGGYSLDGTTKEYPPKYAMSNDLSIDIAYLGGYSLDGTTIYFDRHLPDKIKWLCHPKS